MAGPVDLQEFVVGFVVEAEEYLDSVNRNLVAVSEALKGQKPEPRAVRELFRSLHTIKGLASMVGAEPIAAVAHEMESILRLAERSGGMIPETTLDLLVQGTRVIEARVRAVSEKGVGKLQSAPPALLEALALALNPPTPLKIAPQADFALPQEILKTMSGSDREQVLQASQKGRRIILIEFRPSPENIVRGYNITNVRDRLGKIGEIIKVVPRSSIHAPTGIVFLILLETATDNSALIEASGAPLDLIQEIVSAKPATAPLEETGLGSVLSGEWTPTDHSSVRVDIRRLDDALERLAELVVTRSKMVRVATEMTERGVDTRDLNAVLGENTRQLKRLRAAIIKARMVPLSELFQRLPLVVRGLTKNTNKSVNLVLQVGLAEVDKAVADKIFPAVVHLIRNSVDHGIESREERRRLGKPETATLTVSSDDSSGTNLVLIVADDGQGIDREAVAKKAGRALAVDDLELLAQITMPGLSTRENANLTSGRGMGMDIVSRAVELLGGQLALETSWGIGTKFKLHVPVSITIVDVLSFMAGGQIFTVPVAMVDEIIEVNEGQLTQSPSPSQHGLQSQMIQRRGEAIPFMSLSHLLYKKPAAYSPRALVVRQHRGGTIAFGVDRMLGQQEVVVRPLDDELVHRGGMAGATDLGDGNPTLVLDLAKLGAAFNTYAETNA